MAYCYECGSEVAEIDVFCPYCGISLKPGIIGETDDAADLPSDEVSAPAVDVQTAGESFAEADISTEKTEEDIILTSEPKESAENEITSKPTETNVSPTETKFSDDQPANQPGEAKFDSFSSIPSPAIIENLESFTAVSAKKDDAPMVSAEPEESKGFGLGETLEDEKLEKVEKVGEIRTPENQEAALQKEEIEESTAPIENENALTAGKPELIVKDQAINDEIKSSSPIETSESETENSAEEIEIIGAIASPVSTDVEKESTQFAETPQETATEENQENPLTAAAGEDYTQTIPDIAPLPTESSAFIADKENLHSAESAAEKSGATDLSAEESENASPVITPIAKPEDDLASFDPQSAPSVFDSVRIMEDSQGKRPRIEENLAPINVSAEQTAQKPAVSADSAVPENFSHTTPNIGGSDTDGKKAAKLKPLDEGTILNGRYEIVRKIGGGGMGAVYLASDNNLGGVLRAVKEMVQSYIEEEQQEKSINDFRRESMILSTLDHVSIPTIYDYFFDEKESRFYLVMKYINGGDLSGRLRAAPEGKIDERIVTEWSIQIADVLDYLHNRPNTIVYRDLKPANVMIDGNSGRIMLIDFGIARSINKEEKGVTAVGTMGYAPPELFSGNVEPRSDIYSLGSTMFHLMTGADPQSNPLLIFDFQKNPRPRQINSQLSDQMERILMKAVEYNSTARFSSAMELKQCLEEHLDNLKTGRVTYGIKAVPQAVSLENQIVFCGFCGQKIVASDMFCAFCGSKQPLSQQGVHAEIYSHAPQTAKLMILGTSELESPVFNLEKDESFVGRRDPQSGIFPEVDLSKFDPQTKISRRHARIWRDGGNFMVEDLGSSNGTTVIPSVSDAVRLLPHQPHVLATGDKIRIGDTTLHFVRA